MFSRSPARIRALALGAVSALAVAVSGAAPLPAHAQTPPPVAPAPAPAPPPPPAPAPAPAAQSMWSGTGTVSYFLVHKFHEFEGKSPKTEVKAAWSGDTVKVQARARVDSFDSDNSNRDQHMLEVMEASKYPFVVVRGVIGGVVPPTAATQVKTKMKAEVDLHGKVVAREIDVVLDFKDATHVTATFEFVESLEAHGVERPSLLFVKVDDALKIKGSIALEKAP